MNTAPILHLWADLPDGESRYLGCSTYSTTVTSAQMQKLLKEWLWKGELDKLGAKPRFEKQEVRDG